MRRLYDARSRAPAYGLALAAAGFATLPILPFLSFFEGYPFALYYVACATCAWIAGMGAGVAAALISALVVDVLYLPPFHSLDSARPLVQLLFFVTGAAAISYFIAHQRRSDRPSERRDEGREQVGRGTPSALFDLRTHLTVATVAAAQLRRKHVSTVAAARLCVYIIRAHGQMLEDIQALEAELSDSDTR